MCVHACVCKHALRLDDDFFEERVSREYNLFVVVSEKIDPLKVLLFSFLSLSVPQFGWRIFFASFGEREEFAFFSQKNCKERPEREERRAEERLFDEKRENGRREEERVR